MNLFIGSGVAIVTPFTDENEVNFDSLSSLLEFQIQNGTDAIIACGTTGEASTLSDQEYKAVVEFIIKKVNKRKPVIVGTGSNNTKTAIEKSIFAEKSGADGLLVVTPYYNKTTQKGLVEHFKAIASSVNIPIILYNIPGRTGMNMDTSTVAELSKISNIQGIKEASGNIEQVAQISALCGDSINIYAGNDSEILPVLSLGGKGVISTMANIIPNEVHKITSEFLSGNIASSRGLQLKYMELIKTLFIETNPIPVKAALNMLGHNVGLPRLPLVEMSNVNKAKLEAQLKSAGLI